MMRLLLSCFAAQAARIFGLQVSRMWCCTTVVTQRPWEGEERKKGLTASKVAHARRKRSVEHPEERSATVRNTLFDTPWQRHLKLCPLERHPH